MVGFRGTFPYGPYAHIGRIIPVQPWPWAAGRCLAMGLATRARAIARQNCAWHLGFLFSMPPARARGQYTAGQEQGNFEVNGGVSRRAWGLTFVFGSAPGCPGGLGACPLVGFCGTLPYGPCAHIGRISPAWSWPWATEARTGRCLDLATRAGEVKLRMASGIFIRYIWGYWGVGKQRGGSTQRARDESSMTLWLYDSMTL